MRTSVRVIVAAAGFIAVSSLPGYSQDGSSSLQQSYAKRGGPPPGGEKSKKTPAQVKAEESAYADALNRIPASDQKYDPWQSMRDDGSNTSQKNSKRSISDVR